MRMISSGLAAALLFAAPAAALAEDGSGPPASADHMSHDAMQHMGMGSGAAPSTAAYEAAEAAMHEAMRSPFTGNADRDFLNHMIPHHAGAVAMARIVLRYGQNADVRKLAQRIVDDQEREIAEMKEMLKAMGAPASEAR
ncbi:CopM family metallochaperone [Hansschlegelia sp.]|uniref:CopM family metallochaperone n=1 Tax=Hansschlegelia sp. TaxID=2041892 RepID=UPI002CB537C0|nr:DUF305 domain-containing protein [Hansschlegelia sp.]HVI29570.1 DUF305 domain-containing protein [Hansschlegelia sp.]